MTIEAFLQTTTARLAKAGIESARLDCLLLLEDAFGRDRAYLLAHPELEIPAARLENLHKNIDQRATHLPLAYIRGKALFYGRGFMVNPDVLVPRPESEALITLLKKAVGQSPSLQHPLHDQAANNITLADIGTGSGCLGITAALEIPGCEAWLADIDPAVLVVAARNAQAHNAKVHCVEGDLLQALPGGQDFSVVLANLPYVPQLLAVNKAATFEPKIALFGGPDGLDIYKRFWTQLGQRQQKPSTVITEAFPSQHHTLAVLARGAGYYLAQTDGFGQAFARL